MVQFSIIVPFLGDLQVFDDTLASVLRYRPANAQVIVAHDGMYQDRYGLSNELEFAVSGRKAQLIRLFNCGLRQANGEIVALLRPGVEVDENWHESIAQAFEDPNVGSVSPMIVSPLKLNRIVAAGVTSELGFRRRLAGLHSSTARRKLRTLSPLGPTSWAAFYRHSTLAQIGSCDEMLEPVYLDLDLALSIKTLGFKCAFASDCVVSIDRATPLLREANLAHGRSAQRALRRHANDPSLGTTLLTMTAELIRSPWRPWLLQHSIQRLSTGRMADIDRHFAEKISRARRERNWEVQSVKTGRRVA